MSIKRSLKTATRVAEAEITRSETDSHTIKLVWSTGYKGLRNEWGKRFYEELDMSDSAVNLSRLNSGTAPFLTEHERHTQVQLGVITKSWLENGLGYAEVKLSKNRNQDVIQDILDGVLRNVSVGYSVEQFEELKDSAEIPTLVARKWTPVEVSIVSTPFDSGAVVMRSDQVSEQLVEIINPNQLREDPVEEENKEPMDVEAIKAQAIAEYKKQLEDEAKAQSDKDEEERKAKSDEEEKQKEEQERKSKIEIQVRAAGFDEETSRTMTAEFQTRNLTPEQVTQEIFKQMKGKQSPKETKMNKSQLAQEALLNRINARSYKVDASNPYKQATLLQIAEAVVDRNPGESDANFAKRAISSSTLSELLGNTANKVLSESGPEKYAYSKIAEEQSLRDFKSTPIIKMSMTGLSGKSAETDDYTDTAMVDTGENIQLTDRGALYKISYTALMNDDLGFFKKLPQKAETLGARDIEARLFALLNANPTMSDTKALFHADHDNIITGGTAPDVAGVDAAQQLMAAFTDDSSNPMDLEIKYLVVPPSLALAAHQVAGGMVASSSINVNPFQNKVEVIVSSRIAQVGGKDCWFAVCDPEVWSALNYGVLEGQGDRPEVSVEEDFNSKNLKVRVSMPNAVAAASYKGIVRTVLA